MVLPFLLFFICTFAAERISLSKLLTRRLILYAENEKTKYKSSNIFRTYENQKHHYDDCYFRSIDFCSK